MAAKTEKNIDRTLPDFTGANNADRFTPHVESDQTIEYEVTGAISLIRLMQATVQHHHQGDRILGYRIGRVLRYANHTQIV